MAVAEPSVLVRGAAHNVLRRRGHGMTANADRQSVTQAVNAAAGPRDLSVIVGCVEAARSIEGCLRSIRQACEGLDAEVIVVDASRDGTAGIARRFGSEIAVVQRAPGTLTPKLWADGLAASRGRVVAFMTGHCTVPTAWARTLLGGFAAGIAGVGGWLELARGTSVTDWAVFYLRYSDFLAVNGSGYQIVKHIPGDNAAYLREALDRHAGTFSTGFWEVDFHRLLRADGGELALAPQATVTFGRSFPFWTIVRHRFEHGRHFAAGRVASGERSRLRVLLGTPLVPLVLLARIARRVWRRPVDRVRAAAALPWMAILATSWASGEAWGALIAPARRTPPMRVEGAR